MLFSQEPGPSLQRLQVAVTRETQRPQLVLRALERYQRWSLLVRLLHKLPNLPSLRRREVVEHPAQEAARGDSR